jgi:hypothetical protein
VVDFFPKRLEDFARSRKVSVHDVLSDAEDDDDLDDQTDEDMGPLGVGAAKVRWEWRFALLLEDSCHRNGSTKETFWAVVGDPEAQLLTGLDACE